MRFVLDNIIDRKQYSIIVESLKERNPQFSSWNINEDQKDIERSFKGCGLVRFWKNNPDFNKAENHPNWQGGISFEPYCHKFNDKFKEKIRDQFNRECYLCGKSELDNKCKLSIHHVNYDKNTLCNDIKPLFVPLCRSCHGKTSRNKQYWETLFTAMIYYDSYTL